MDRIRLVDYVPELLEGLGPADRDAAVVPTLALPVGPWTPDLEQLNSTTVPGGVLVVAGLVSRRTSVGKRAAAELIGPGDLVRPWVSGRAPDMRPADVAWEVHERARLALLDREFVERLPSWPTVANTLMDLLSMRSRQLSFQLAIRAQREVRSRVLILLWHLGDRWGARQHDSVHLPLHLKHELIAAVVGASRPTVSSAVAALQRAGLVSRRGPGEWVLHGKPPPELRRRPHTRDEDFDGKAGRAARRLASMSVATAQPLAGPARSD